MTSIGDDIMYLLDDCEALAKSWGILDNPNTLGQFGKLKEEVSELEEDLNDTDADPRTELGDVIFVSLVLARQLGSSLEECLDLAYKKNSKRKGRLINGVFIKEGDL